MSLDDHFRIIWSVLGCSVRRYSDLIVCLLFLGEKMYLLQLLQWEVCCFFFILFSLSTEYLWVLNCFFGRFEDVNLSLYLDVPDSVLLRTIWSGCFRNSLENSHCQANTHQVIGQTICLSRSIMGKLQPIRLIVRKRYSQRFQMATQICPEASREENENIKGSLLSRTHTLLLWCNWCFSS